MTDIVKLLLAFIRDCFRSPEFKIACNNDPAPGIPQCIDLVEKDWN